MALELYMLGLVVRDMHKALEFYRRLGLAVPEGSTTQTHVDIKMESGLTLFLDSNPALWDPGFARENKAGNAEITGSYRSVLEFYLKTQTAVTEKYNELTGLGFRGRRAPYATAFGMCFAMIDDPDGNTILLSGDLENK